MKLALKPTAIGEVVDRSKSWNPSRSSVDEVFQYIDLSAVDQDAKVITGAREVSCCEAPSRARQLVESGDILVSTVRPNLNGVARVPEQLDGATASTGFCVLRANKTKASGAYLFHWVKSSAFISDMVSKATGASYPAVSDRIIFESQIPLPPLAEQKRIAAILDAADALRTKRRETLAQLDALLQSTFLTLFGDPVENPMRWPKSTIDELVDNIDSGWSPTCLDRPANDMEWGVLKLGAVTYCIYRDDLTKALPSGLTPRPEIEVQKGDLLFARKNTYDLVAACAYVHETRPKLMLPDLIFRLRLSKAAKTEPIFMWQQLVVPRLRKHIQSFAGGAAGSMPNISKAKLRAIEVICPPLPLQQKFAAIVESVERQKAAQCAHLAELDALFAALQHRAFRGEL